jgi:hypothetical protein
VTADSALPTGPAAGPLLAHIADALTGVLPRRFALAGDGARVLLLERGAVHSSAFLATPGEDPDLADLAEVILDEAQDLMIFALGRPWPDGPASHPGAMWRESRLVLGYFPDGDPAREPVLGLPEFTPPTAPSRSG